MELPNQDLEVTRFAAISGFVCTCLSSNSVPVCHVIYTTRLTSVENVVILLIV